MPPPRLVVHVLVGMLAIVAVQSVAERDLSSLAGLSRPSVVQAEPGAVGASSPVTMTVDPASPDVPMGLVPSAPPLIETASPHTADPSPAAAVASPAAASDGPSISANALASRPTRRVWRGTAGQDVYLRATPNRDRPPVGGLKAGQAVEVVGWVSGEEIEPQNPVWAELSTGQFVFAGALRRAPLAGPPEPPAGAPTEGRWIDVNLTEQVATAYEGRTSLKSVLISSGRPGWSTPAGTFRIARRVEKETMDGSTLIGMGPEGRGASYKIENVRFTQYFTSDGAAIHENFWRRPALFGIPGSHGCIGMLPADAAWFWEFATAGTPLVVHD